jgi:Zn-dependent M16 (insulinase) family peptidase
MPTIDSSFSLHITRGLASYTDPRMSALKVALAYLDAVEGPLWVAVRGTGLAYGTSFTQETTIGSLKFSIYRSPDAHKAFLASKKVVEDFVSGTTEIDSLSMEGAISSIVVGIADEQPTMVSAASMEFRNRVVREVPANYNEELLRKVREVTAEQIREVLRDIVMPVFVPETSNLYCTCAPVMEKVRLALGIALESDDDADVFWCV